MQILGDERAASHLFVFDIKQFPDSVHQGFSAHCARRLLIQVKSALTDSLIFHGKITKRVRRLDAGNGSKDPLSASDDIPTAEGAFDLSLLLEGKEGSISESGVGE